MHAKTFAICLGLLLIQSLHPGRLLAVSQEVIEAAKKEGEVIWYGAGSNAIDNKIGRGFMKKYPSIKPKKFRISAYKLLVRFRAESRADRHIADIVRTTDAILETFRKEGLLIKYASPERKFYIDELKDRDGYYTAFYNFRHVIAYNTNLVPKGEVPRSYEDLLKPRWKGEMGIPDGSAGFIWFANQLKIRGEEKGLKLIRELAKQEPTVISSQSQLVKLVGAGEYAIAINSYAYRIERLKKRGAPIDWVPVEPVVIHNLFGGISKNAPHPNAAKLFMDYLLSEAGQKVYISQGVNPARTGLKAPWLPKLKVFYSDPVEMSERYGEFEKRFRKMFRARQR